MGRVSPFLWLQLPTPPLFDLWNCPLSWTLWYTITSLVTQTRNFRPLFDLLSYFSRAFGCRIVTSVCTRLVCSVLSLWCYSHCPSSRVLKGISCQYSLVLIHLWFLVKSWSEVAWVKGGMKFERICLIIMYFIFGKWKRNLFLYVMESSSEKYFLFEGLCKWEIIFCEQWFIILYWLELRNICWVLNICQVPSVLCILSHLAS